MIDYYGGGGMNFSAYFLVEPGFFNWKSRQVVTKYVQDSSVKWSNASNLKREEFSALTNL